MNLLTTTVMMLGLLSTYDKPIHTNPDRHYAYVLPIEDGTYNRAVTYEELLYQATFNCRSADPAKIDYSLLVKLIEIEKSYNPPPAMRGMILAAACMESGYNPKAKGDRKFSKSKKKPMAIGILQMWPIYEKMFPGLKRTDPEAAAHGWMKHIVRQIPKVKRMCRYKTEDKIWLAAWVTGIRYKKKGGRCKEAPKHYRLLRKWHRNIEKQREWKMNGTADGDGC
jgi:hypothetical protein